MGGHGVVSRGGGERGKGKEGFFCGMFCVLCFLVGGGSP